MWRPHPIPLGWLQLWHRKLRLCVALAGIAFAVILILMQLGFSSALYDSAVRYQKRLQYDIALFSHDSQFIVRPQPFPRERLYQALAVEGVRAVSPVYAAQAVWKNPYTLESRSIYVLGVDPNDDVLDTPGASEQRDLIRRQDVVLFDVNSRPEYGPIGERFAAGERIVAEVNDREMRVEGVFEMGTSFGIEASLLTSNSNFLRIFPSRSPDEIAVGLISLHEGISAEAVRDQLRGLLPSDVLVLTKADFVSRETDYWKSTSPIGFIFTFGAIMGFVVGAIIVYQILFSDVNDHLAEYATLRAIGYPKNYLSGVVVQQALILAVLGYVPGVLAALYLYGLAGRAINIPMELGAPRGLTVLGLTIAMCAISGLLALRRVRALDPAEVF